MIAEKIRVETTPQPKVRLRRRAGKSHFTLALSVVVLASSAAISYTAACAVATSRGYSRMRMQTELKQLQTQNQLLAAEVQELESPKRLTAAAQQSGMELKCQAQCLGQAPAFAGSEKLRNKIASNLPVNP